MFKAHSDGGSRGASPFRFMYMSGSAAERDQKKTPSLMPEYCLMRVSTAYAPCVQFWRRDNRRS